mmetsp:Transcript_15671/g.28013  ORF Transcript_15671/g.28013 Transcript_15671/m.28013 type:complete len:250 (+) Transcript_15671:1158-1907(+)
MCITHATIDGYHIRKVCASSTRPQECGVSAGTNTSYSRVNTLVGAAPPEPHFSRVYRLVAFHSFATKYRSSSPKERRLSSNVVCSLRCCEPSSWVPCARYALHVKCDMRNWKHTTGTSSSEAPAFNWKGPVMLSGHTRSHPCSAPNSVRRLISRSRPVPAVASPGGGWGGGGGTSCIEAALGAPRRTAVRCCGGCGGGGGGGGTASAPGCRVGGGGGAIGGHGGGDLKVGAFEAALARGLLKAASAPSA